MDPGIFDNDSALQVCLHPLQEVIHADNSKIEQSITEVIETLGKHRINGLIDLNLNL